MEHEINLLKSEIPAWQTLLNTEGMWLFLGTLGCWSVQPTWLRYIAFMLTLVFFFWRTWGKRKDKKTFDNRISDLEKNILCSSQLEGVELDIVGKAHLYDLHELKEMLSFVSLIKYGAVYLACTLFWFASVCYS